MNENEIVGKKVLNEIVDEVYELDNEEEMLQERSVKNQQIDHEVIVSDDSKNYIPTPDSDEQEQNLADESEAELESEKELSHHSSFNLTNRDHPKEQYQQDMENLNLDPDTLSIFKYIDQYNPEQVDLELKLQPFLPDYLPAVGEVDSCIKIPRPDLKEDGLGIEQFDEFL